MADAERILLGYLHRHCRGVAGARTYARLRQDLERETGLVVGDREMYELVQSLVLAGRPVGTISSNGGGAFVIETARDARLAYRNLYGRVCRQLRRCRALKRTIRETISGQRYLDLADAGRAYESAVAENRGIKDSAGAQGLLFGGLAPGSRT